MHLFSKGKEFVDNTSKHFLCNVLVKCPWEDSLG